MYLNYATNAQDRPCLMLGLTELQPGNVIEVRLLKRGWLPVTLLAWSGRQDDDPVFEIYLTKNMRGKLELPMSAEYRQYRP